MDTTSASCSLYEIGDFLMSSFYLLIPIYPLIVLCLNIYSLHEFCRDKRLGTSIVITLVTLYVTVVNMPIFVGLLCQVFRLVECENK